MARHSRHTSPKPQTDRPGYTANWNPPGQDLSRLHSSEDENLLRERGNREDEFQRSSESSGSTAINTAADPIPIIPLSERSDYAVRQGEVTSLETPKRASSQRRRTAFRNIISFHLAPVLFTVALTLLYIRMVFWDNYSPTNKSIQLGLQVAAKMHEALIVMSLTHILLHRLRYLMLRSHGVPLGLVASPSYLGNPLYLLYGEFRGAAQESIHSLSAFSTIALTIGALVMATAVGPLSATILIPREGIWPLPPSSATTQQISQANFSVFWDPNIVFDHSNGYFYKALNVTELEIYPVNVGRDLGLTEFCESDDQECQVELNPLQELVYTASVGLPKPPINPDYQSSGLTVSPFSTTIYTNISSWFLNSETGDLYIATCPLQMTYDATEAVFVTLDEPLGSDIFLKSFGSTPSDRLPTKQPVLMMQTCWVDIYWNGTSPMEGLITPDPLPCNVGSYPAFNISVESLISSTNLSTYNWTSGSMIFADIQSLIPFPISTATVSLKSYSPDPETQISSGFLDVNLIIGSWEMAEDLFGNTGTSSLYTGALTQPLDYYFNITNVIKDEIIQFDSNWLNDIITTKFSVSDLTTINENMTLSQYFSLRQDFYARAGLTTLLASILALAPCRFDICNKVITSTPLPQSSAEAVSTEGVSIIIQLFQDGYAYSFFDPDGKLNVTILAGFIILYLHALIVIVHISFIIFGGFWTSTVWSSLSEVIVLALRSSPRVEYRGTSAGIENLETWQLKTVVREDPSTQRLELVIEPTVGNEKQKELPKLLMSTPDKLYD